MCSSSTVPVVILPGNFVRATDPSAAAPPSLPTSDIQVTGTHWPPDGRNNLQLILPADFSVMPSFAFLFFSCSLSLVSVPHKWKNPQQHTMAASHSVVWPAYLVHTAVKVVLLSSRWESSGSGHCRKRQLGSAPALGRGHGGSTACTEGFCLALTTF